MEFEVNDPSCLEISSDNSEKLCILQLQLFYFQMLYHRNWYRTIDDARSGLAASLLIRDPETKKIYVNFDPSILEVIQEAKCMNSMNLDVPPAASNLVVKEEMIKDNYVS